MKLDDKRMSVGFRYGDKETIAKEAVRNVPHWAGHMERMDDERFTLERCKV